MQNTEQLCWVELLTCNRRGGETGVRSIQISRGTRAILTAWFFLVILGEGHYRFIAGIFNLSLINHPFCRSYTLRITVSLLKWTTNKYIK
jgi:hypothetical protein